MDKDMPFHKKYLIENTVLLAPPSLEVPACLAHFPIYFYHIDNKNIDCSTYPDNKTLLIYAPYLIGTWLLYKAHETKNPKIKILIDQRSILNKYNHLLLTCHLLYERFRLGSDVTSPFISRILHYTGHYQVLKDITIGDWLTCLKSARLHHDHHIMI